MKRLLLLLFITSLSISMIAQVNVYQLSTHILDISEGKPSPNVTVYLEVQNENNDWIKVAEQKTDINGRIGSFLKINENQPDQNKGTYRLTFLTGDYFNRKSIESFYPFIQVVFTITDDTHYHVPITLSPFGYSTYRGS